MTGTSFVYVHFHNKNFKNKHQIKKKKKRRRQAQNQGRGNARQVRWVPGAWQRLGLTLGVEVHAVHAPLQLLQALVHLQGTHAVATIQLPLNCTEELRLRQGERQGRTEPDR